MHFHILAQGTFNNYVDQILPNFGPLSPIEGTIVDVVWTFYMRLKYRHDTTLCPVTKRGLFTDPLPPLLVHVVINDPF